MSNTQSLGFQSLPRTAVGRMALVRTAPAISGLDRPSGFGSPADEEGPADAPWAEHGWGLTGKQVSALVGALMVASLAVGLLS